MRTKLGARREAIRGAHRHTEYRDIERHPIVILADNIDKSSNLGGIMRVADSFLCEQVLTNRTEIDAGGAMGAEHWQPATWGVSLPASVDVYRSRGYATVSLEQCPTAIPLHDFRFPKQTLLIIGSEAFGVSESLLAGSDHVVFIPQAGLVKSLNVVTATAIALYEYSRQWWMPGFTQPQRHLSASSESLRVFGAGKHDATHRAPVLDAGTQSSRG